MNIVKIYTEYLLNLLENKRGNYSKLDIFDAYNERNK